jgi:hypothetical protein
MTNDATPILNQLDDIATSRLDFLDRAIALGKSLTGPDDSRAEEFRSLLREERTQTSSLLKELERMLADLTDRRVVPLPDNTGR